MMKTIAVIEDDQYIGDMLCEVLEREGYGVIRAYSGTEALLLLSSSKADLVLLDLMLPGLSGEELLPKISDIPVIIVSARTGIDDKVKLLMSGAVDYVEKPFDTRELLARIAVNLRERPQHGEDELTADELTLNTVSCQVSVKGSPVKLTKTEYAILKLLMKNPGQVLSKSSILDCICADTPDCVESSLKVHVSNLRIKLREVGGKDYIEAIWGIGFRLKTE